MKKIIFTLIFGVMAAMAANAQKFALVDMEYILKNIPAYEMANEQLNQLSQRWQREVDQAYQDADALYKDYMSNKVFLTDEQVKAKETEIVAKEREASELKAKYFGPEGELYQKRQSLMKPIQDDIYNAVKKVAEEKGYQMVMDRASASDIIFASPRIDVSNEVLAKMGYSK
ncbi:MAG: OmpH family outer membrane protein [Muribaculaceae bacterium]|nr:OmpH family outer membrane protein [Muribaculaceae bacterium]